MSAKVSPKKQESEKSNDTHESNKYSKVSEEVIKSGSYKILPNGVSARSAASIDLEHLNISLNSYLSALGLTPTGRAKMGIEARQHNDPLSELSRRRLARESKLWNKDK